MCRLQSNGMVAKKRGRNGEMQNRQIASLRGGRASLGTEELAGQAHRKLEGLQLRYRHIASGRAAPVEQEHRKLEGCSKASPAV